MVSVEVAREGVDCVVLCIVGGTIFTCKRCDDFLQRELSVLTRSGHMDMNRPSHDIPGTWRANLRR